jgi:hypothetical protein
MLSNDPRDLVLDVSIVIISLLPLLDKLSMDVFADDQGLIPRTHEAPACFHPRSFWSSFSRRLLYGAKVCSKSVIILYDAAPKLRTCQNCSFTWLAKSFSSSYSKSLPCLNSSTLWGL